MARTHPSSTPHNFRACHRTPSSGLATPSARALPAAQSPNPAPLDPLPAITYSPWRRRALSLSLIALVIAPHFRDTATGCWNAVNDCFAGASTPPPSDAGYRAGTLLTDVGAVAAVVSPDVPVLLWQVLLP